MTTNELLSRHWLSDSTLHQYFDVINNRFFQCKAGLILNPIIVQGLKCVSDFNYVIDELSLKTYKYLFVPVSDAEAMCTVEGSHWSLFIFEKDSNTFFY